MGIRWVIGSFVELLRRSVTLLPRTLAGLALRLTGRPEPAREQLSHVDPDARWSVPASLLLVPMGLLCLLGVFLATLDEIRVVFLYWLTDYLLIGGGSIGPGTWGGPSLAGAWLVHAVLGIVLLPVFLGVMYGLTRLAALVVRAPRAGWVVPVALLVDLVVVAFLVAFVRQL